MQNFCSKNQFSEIEICKKKVEVKDFYTEIEIIYKRIGDIFLPFCLSLDTKGIQRFDFLPVSKTFCQWKKLLYLPLISKNLLYLQIVSLDYRN